MDIKVEKKESEIGSPHREGRERCQAHRVL